MYEPGRRRNAAKDFDERRAADIVMSTYQTLAATNGDTLSSRPPRGAVEYRSAEPGDASSLATLHSDAISTGFLPTLGHRFLTRLYSSLIEWPGSEIVVAAADGRVVGFVAGVADTSTFYRRFVARDGIKAAVAAGHRLLRVETLRGVLETYRYNGANSDVLAELLAMAVAQGARRRGIGTELVGQWLDRMNRRGYDRIRVVVDADNDAAIAVYHRLGFVDTASIEVHEGTASELLVWEA